MHFFKPKSYCVQANFPIHHGKNYTRDGKHIHCGSQGPLYLLLTFTWTPAVGKNKGLDLGLYPASGKQWWRKRWEVATLDCWTWGILHQTKGWRVQGLSSFPRQFRWWNTRRKRKVQTQLHESVLLFATSLAFLYWYRDISLKIALTIAFAILCFYNRYLVIEKEFSLNQNYRNQPAEWQFPFHNRVVQGGLFWLLQLRHSLFDDISFTWKANILRLLNLHMIKDQCK